MSLHRHNSKPLQQALWQAAKVGHLSLMQELIAAGADPFIHDEHGRNAISYAAAADPVKTGILLMELLIIAENHSEAGDRDE